MLGTWAKMRLTGGGAAGKEILIQYATQAQCANTKPGGLEEFAP